jgi:hypothetical protein
MTFKNTPVGGDEISTSGLFPGHPREGDWETLEGMALAPHIQMPMESTAHTAVRYAPAGTGNGWASTIIVNTGMTPGGGTMAAK